MDKQQAQQIIRSTFEADFDKGRFTGFVRNLLNHIEDAPFTYQGNYIPEKFRQYIKSLERIGKFSDGENSLDIVVITLQKETSLERARTMQRNFIAWYLNGSRGGNMKDAALVAYVAPDQVDWRFSLVKMDYRFEKTSTGKVKVKEEFTPARRWSFLVGANEKSHTAQSRLVNILANDEQAPTLAELENAFDIETVTKEFFLKYRELFLRTKEALDKVVKNNPNVKADFDAKGVDTVNFAKKLLGQIVFLYFLQKKGWFGVGRDDDWGTGSKHFLRQLFTGSHGGYQNFFNDILEPLFYEALRIDRSHDDDYYSHFNCKIPFLNGGLFDPIGNYDWVHTDIHLPNDLFSNSRKTKEGDIGEGILDVFDRYNFTVREDEPLEKEVAIDPELLGKAYEKFNAIRPDNFIEFTRALKSGKKGEENKFNKKFGVYYTPREIVHYMCKQSLINYLYTQSEEAGLSSVIKKQDIEDLIEVGELITEHEATALIKQEKIKNGSQKSTEYTALLADSIRENAAAIDKWLEEITVCDPAVGSGAFPVGMMNEIVRARNVLSVFLKGQTRNDYEFKRRCIEHSLYGVDIDPGAVEIAKLRLWLSLVVDEENIKTIKPLPNLDYRIMQGNSLISEFMGINFDADENKNRKEKISELETKEKEINIKINEKERYQLQFYNNYHKQNTALSKELDELNKNKEKVRNEIARKSHESEKNDIESIELSEVLKKFQREKDEFLNESNVSCKVALKEKVENLLVQIFESKLKKEKADFFNRLKDIENKYSVLPNEKQKNELIKQAKRKLYKLADFDLEAAENQLKEFTSGKQIKPFFLWNLYYLEVFHNKGGFDVVIANPPYVRANNMDKKLRDHWKKSGKFETISGKFDIYILFIEKAIKLLNNNGLLSYIVPYPVLSQNYAKLVRNYILQKCCIESIYDISEIKVFDAAVSTCVLIIRCEANIKIRSSNIIQVRKSAVEYSQIRCWEIPQIFFENTFQNMYRLNAVLGADKVLERMWKVSKPFSDYCYVGIGIDVHDSKTGLDKSARIHPISKGVHYRPYVEGKEIERYCVPESSRYLEYLPEKMHRPKYPEMFETEKILVQVVVGREGIIATFDNKNLYAEQTLSLCVPKYVLAPTGKKDTEATEEQLRLSKDHDLLYLLGLLCSKLINWYFQMWLSDELHVVPENLRQLPMRKINFSKVEEKAAYHEILKWVKQILCEKRKNHKADITKIENQIDQLVYQLYGLTEEELCIVESERK